MAHGFKSIQKLPEISFLSVLHKKSKSYGLDFFILGASDLKDVSHPRRLASIVVSRADTPLLILLVLLGRVTKNTS